MKCRGINDKYPIIESRALHYRGISHVMQRLLCNGYDAIFILTRKTFDKFTFTS